MGQQSTEKTKRNLGKIIDWLIFWSGSKYAPDKQIDQKKLSKCISELQFIYKNL